VVVAVNGEAVKDSWSLQQVVANHRPGEELRLDVVRGGKHEEVRVRLGDVPA
jgi:serine protease Do